MSAVIQPTLFEGSRMQMDESIKLTLQSLEAYGKEHDVWCVGYSGGKDSTALVTFLAWAVSTGQIEPPKKIIVLYADTRMELTPLSICAMDVCEQLQEEFGFDVRVVVAPLDERFFVYMFGKGVPPPSNTFRWCTPRLKVEPMEAAISQLLEDEGIDGNALMLTGVRIGESAARDDRIALSCGKDGSECGQGWYQKVLPNSKSVKGRIATLAPLLHWRVCHVWRWLRDWATTAEFGDFNTRLLAEAYGGDEAEETNARTGCMGCPLASQDKALEAVVNQQQWAYLRPLLELRDLYRELKEPKHRKRKDGTEKRKDGSSTKNPYRMGPLKLTSRRYATGRVLDIQERCNEQARHLNRPLVDILNPEEVARIEQLISSDTWPQGWDGTEQDAEVMQHMLTGRMIQPMLSFGAA